MREDEHPDFMGYVDVLDDTPDADDPRDGKERHALVYVSPGGYMALTYHEHCYALWRTDEGRNVGGVLWKSGNHRLSPEACAFAKSRRYDATLSAEQAEIQRLRDEVDAYAYGRSRRPEGSYLIQQRDRLREERDALKAEVDRLTRERDEARAAMALVVEGLSEARANRSGPTIRPHLEAVWGLLIDQGVIK